jgi:phage gpG-like protein
MARSFNSIGEFVAFMSRQVATLPKAQHHALEEGAAIVLKEAKSYPGEYQKGWPALADATKDARTLAGHEPNEPLLVTGELRESYADKVIDAHHAAVGSDDDKAVWQEMGTPTIPQRPVLALAGAAKEAEVVEAIARRIHGHMVGHG